MSNYYLALGIDKDADLDKIKKAYRYYCKQYHPDTSSEDDKKKFLIIQEAYETLKDKQKRKKYDNSINDNSVPVNFVNSDFFEKKRSTGKKIREYSSLLDEYLESFVNGFFEEGFSSNKELFLELILNHTEAENGGDFPIEIPVLKKCKNCKGTGYINAFLCPSCKGTGRVQSRHDITLHIPSGVYDGLETTVPLEGMGLSNVFLHVDIIVEN
jgi:molecular chaperone DnaJ